MSKRCVQWLYRELPGLVRQGVVSDDTADRLRRHYGDAGGLSGRLLALTICSVLGALLVGSGIILVLAHNWQALSRPVRTVLSLLPLVTAQGAAVWCLATGRRSTPWREGVGLFWSLAIAATIALIGQTYHIPGDTGAFLLTWTLLVLPILYLQSSVSACLIYMAGITAWAGCEQSMGGQALGFWPLLALAVPFIVRTSRQDPASVASALLGWGGALCLCVATGITLEKGLPGLWIIVYSGLFASMYLAGVRWGCAEESLWLRPLVLVGAGGVAVLALLLSWEWPWDAIGWTHYRTGSRYSEWAALLDYVLAVVLPGAAVVLGAQEFAQGMKVRLIYAVLPVLAVAAYAVTSVCACELPSMLVFNVYLLALGVSTMTIGVRQGRLGVVNAGMAMVTGLIVSRFFDSDLGILARGVAFIVLGVAFLVTNIVLARRMQGRLS